MNSKPLEQAQQVILIGLGIGLLYGGYKLYKGAQAAAGALTGAPGLPHLPGAPAGVIPGGHADETTPEGQKCHTDVGWFSQTQQCDALPEPPAVKAQGRAARLKWGMDNANPHSLLDALGATGTDESLEADVFAMAGTRWHDPEEARSKGKPLGADNYDGDFYGLNRDWGKILIWYGAHRSSSDAAKQAAANGDVKTLADFATGATVL